MLNKSHLKLILILLFLVIFSGCTTQQYLACKSNLSDVKDELKECNQDLEMKQDILKEQVGINNQLKNNETYVLENADFENVKDRYLQENYFLSISYETVINIIFYFQLVFTFTIPIIFKFGKNKIVIGSLTLGSLVITILIGGLL